MSRETSLWLNTNVLVGMTDLFGDAWHKVEGATNHYPLGIPLADVAALFGKVQIERAPITATLADGTTIPYDSRLANVNVAGGSVEANDLYGQIYGAFGTESYTSHDFKEWLMTQTAHLIGGADSLEIHGAGLLKMGAVAYVQVGKPETVTIAGETYTGKILASTSHDGSLVTTYRVVFTRVVCDNTFGAAMAEGGNVVKVRHSRYSALKIDSARDALGLIVAGADEFSAMADSLLAEPVDDKRFSAWVDAYKPIPTITDGDKTNGLTFAQNAQDALRGLWNHDTRISEVKGTAWGVAQVADTYARHKAIVRGTDRTSRTMLDTITGKSDGVIPEALKVLATV